MVVDLYSAGNVGDRLRSLVFARDYISGEGTEPMSGTTSGGRAVMGWGWGWLPVPGVGDF